MNVSYFLGVFYFSCTGMLITYISLTQHLIFLPQYLLLAILSQNNRSQIFLPRPSTMICQCKGVYRDEGKFLADHKMTALFTSVRYEGGLIFLDNLPVLYWFCCTHFETTQFISVFYDQRLFFSTMLIFFLLNFGLQWRNTWNIKFSFYFLLFSFIFFLIDGFGGTALSQRKNIITPYHQTHTSNYKKNSQVESKMILLFAFWFLCGLFYEKHPKPNW